MAELFCRPERVEEQSKNSVIKSTADFRRRDLTWEGPRLRFRSKRGRVLAASNMVRYVACTNAERSRFRHRELDPRQGCSRHARPLCFKPARWPAEAPPIRQNEMAAV